MEECWAEYRTSTLFEFWPKCARSIDSWKFVLNAWSDFESCSIILLSHIFLSESNFSAFISTDMTENKSRQKEDNTQWRSPDGPDAGMMQFMVIALNLLATRAAWNIAIFILLLLLVLIEHKILMQWEIWHILLNEKGLCETGHSNVVLAWV